MTEFASTEGRKWSKKIWVRYLLLTLLCLFLGFIDGMRSYVSTYRDGAYYADLERVVLWDITGWLVWIPFIPFVFWLSNRKPLNQKSWPTTLPVYVLLGVLISAARTFLPVLAHILLFDGLADLNTWLPDKFYILITDFLSAIVFYACVLAFGQAKNYYRQYNDEEMRSSQLELQLSKAQLQALKMQLHPHFLFNALNSVSALQMEDPEKAQQMLARLGEFLRITLDNVGVQEVSLEQEIEFLKCYLDIEQIRFGERLSTNINIAPEARDCRVPNLILQPLVENAIRHGIAPKTADGQINISADQEQGWLRVKIEDNGEGIEGEKLADVFCTGVGLSNTRARLDQLYGRNFRFDLEVPRTGRGLLVTLCLPWKVIPELQN